MLKNISPFNRKNRQISTNKKYW